MRFGFFMILFVCGVDDFAGESGTSYCLMDLVKGRLTVQVVSTLAEILWEQQLKTIRISSTGRTSKVQKPSSLQSMEYLLAFLDGTDAKENDCFVYVFIHNINGPGLRDSESQHYLALLANCSNIRVVASINHVNTVLYIGRKIWKTKAYVNRTYRASQGCGIFTQRCWPLFSLVCADAEIEDYGFEYFEEEPEEQDVDFENRYSKGNSPVILITHQLSISTPPTKMVISWIAGRKQLKLSSHYSIYLVRKSSAGVSCCLFSRRCQCNRNLGWLNPTSDKIPNKFRKL
ncbi:hypothetical protein C5167_026424, partial [Papaver somniferum]